MFILIVRDSEGVEAGTVVVVVVVSAGVVELEKLGIADSTSGTELEVYAVPEADRAASELAWYAEPEEEGA